MLYVLRVSLCVLLFVFPLYAQLSDGVKKVLGNPVSTTSLKTVIESVATYVDSVIIKPVNPHWFDAIALFPPATNGADLDTLNVRKEVYNFDSATAETLYTEWFVPLSFTSLDSIKIRGGANSTSGDSVSLNVGYLAIAVGESITSAMTLSQADTIDLGTTANIKQELSFTGAFSNIEVKDEVIFRIYRDVSIANDETGDFYIWSFNIYWH